MIQAMIVRSLGVKEYFESLRYIHTYNFQINQPRHNVGAAFVLLFRGH